MKTIEFYFDFTSPYAYLASTQIDALAARHQCEAVWRPFLIGATFKITGRKGPLDHPLVGEYVLNDVQRFARLLKQPLNYPKKFPILGVKASRLFYFLEAREGNQQQAKAFAQAVYKAYFVNQEDVMDSAVLTAIGAPFGFSRSDVDEIVRSPEMKARFKAVVDGAIERGIFGAPMCIVDGEMFWGVDRLNHLDKWLKKGAW